jgi:Family of unknown function (DUF5330)
MSLTRTSLVVGAIVFALPLPSTAPQTASNAHPRDWHVMAVASENFTDLKTFCLRQPNVCSTADSIAARLEAKALFGLQLLTDWAEEATMPRTAVLANEQAEADPMTTGSTVPLTISDLVTGWRGSILPGEG